MTNLLSQEKNFPNLLTNHDIHLPYNKKAINIMEHRNILQNMQMKHQHQLLSKTKVMKLLTPPKIVAKYFKSPNNSPCPPTTQNQSDKPAGTPENTSKLTDEVPTIPTLQNKSDKPSVPKKILPITIQY